MNGAGWIGFWATCIGIWIGGGIVSLIHNFQRSIGTIYAICAGLLLGLISFEIAPEALELANGFIVGAGFLVGAVVYKMMHGGFHQKESEDPQSYNKKMGLFLAFVLSIHNFPMGVMLAANDDAELNGAFIQTILLHHIPEGMILFTPVLLAGASSYILLILAVIVAIPMLLGAYASEFFSMQSSLLWTFFISMTVGSIYMIAIKEILPQAIRRTSNTYSLIIAVIAFLCIGLYSIFV